MLIKTIKICLIYYWLIYICNKIGSIMVYIISNEFINYNNITWFNIKTIIKKNTLIKKI